MARYSQTVLSVVHPRGDASGPTDWIDSAIAQYDSEAVRGLLDSFRMARRQQRFDRPDYPPNEWIFDVLPPFDPAAITPAIEQLSQSYRNIIIQQLHLCKGVGGVGGSNQEDLRNTSAAVRPLAQSFRLPPRRSRFDRPDYPNTSGWFSALPILDAATVVGPANHLAGSFRLAARRGRLDRPHYPDTSWAFPDLPSLEVYDAADWPAIAQLLPSYRAPNRRFYSSDTPRLDWIANEAAAFDPSFISAIEQLVQSYRRVVLQQLALNRGSYSSRGGQQTPVTVDDSILSGIWQLLQSYRSQKRLHDFLYTIHYRTTAAIEDDRFIYTPAKYPAMGQQLGSFRQSWPWSRAVIRYRWEGLHDRSFELTVVPQRMQVFDGLQDANRPKERSKAWQRWLESIQEGWKFTGQVPPAPFDAALWPSIDQLVQSRELRGARPQPLVPDPACGWLFEGIPEFDASLYVPGILQASLPRSAPRLYQDWRKYLDPDDLAWVFTNLPAFEAALTVAQQVQWQQYRSETREKEPWISDPDYAWTFNSLPPFDPATTVPPALQMFMERMGERALEPWITAPGIGDWLGIHVAPYDPVVYAALLELLHSGRMDEKHVLELTQQWFQDPFSWIFTPADLPTTAITALPSHLRRANIAPQRAYRRRIVARRRRLEN